MTNYDEYLDTDHWKKMRTKIRRRARGWCERCKVNYRDDIHHLTYEHLGNEQLSELIGVCRPCHEYLHGKQCNDPAAIQYTKDEIKTIRECKFYYSIGCENIYFSRHPEAVHVWGKYKNPLPHLPPHC